MSKRILIITTNYAGCDCGAPKCNCIKETGVYLEEFAVPFLVFEKSGFDITTASPNGMLSPVDEKSMSCSNPQEWDKCIKILRNTRRLSQIDYKDFDGVYFPGGHGPMFDLAESEEVAKVVRHFFNEGKLISAICHGAAALVKARREDGKSILEGKRITAFTNKEEEIGKLQDFVPFMLETKLRELGAEFIAGEPWSEHVEVDKNFITGQNQNSALLLAEKIVNWYNENRNF